MPDEIGGGIGTRIIDRMADPGLRPEMRDPIEGVRRQPRVELACVREITAKKGERAAVAISQDFEPIMLELRIIIRIETVQPDHPFAPRQQPVGQMKADETGGAGDKHGHLVPARGIDGKALRGPTALAGRTNAASLRSARVFGQSRRPALCRRGHPRAGRPPSGMSIVSMTRIIGARCSGWARKPSSPSSRGNAALLDTRNHPATKAMLRFNARGGGARPACDGGPPKSPPTCRRSGGEAAAAPFHRSLRKAHRQVRAPPPSYAERWPSGRRRSPGK